MRRNAKKMRAGAGKALSVFLSVALLLSVSFPSAATAQAAAGSVGAGSGQSVEAADAGGADAIAAPGEQAAGADEGDETAAADEQVVGETGYGTGDGEAASDAGLQAALASVGAVKTEENVQPAGAGATAFAVYSADDSSLSFYKRAGVPKAGDTFEGKTATAVYTGIETDTYGARTLPWGDYRFEVKTAKVVDVGIKPVSTAYWLYGCFNMTSVEGFGKLDTGAAVSMQRMFYACTALASLDLSGWDVGAAESIRSMFEGCSSLVSLNLSGWNAGAVTDARRMLFRCSSLASVDLSGWDTRAVTDMNSMFYGCSSLTSLDLSGWDTGAVTSMDYMFSDCSKLQQVTLGDKWKWVGTDGYLPEPSSSSIPGADGNWYSSSGKAYAASAIPTGVADTYYASESLVPKTAFAVYSDDDKSLGFYKRAGVPKAGDTFEGMTATAVYTGIETDTYSYDNVPWQSYRSSIQTAKVVDEGISPVSTAYWFYDCPDMARTEGLAKLDTGKVTDMSYMFCGCSSLTSLYLSGWNTGVVEDMSCMFRYCSSLASVDGISGWGTGAVTSMAGMFDGCSSLPSLDLSRWNTGAVTDMGCMFFWCSSLASLDLTGWDTRAVTDMNSMFYGCSSLASLDLSGWDTRAATSMFYMFANCPKLASLGDISDWDTGAVHTMILMFYGCSSLASLDLSGWDTRAVGDMSRMFYGCSSLASLDLSGWDTGAVDGMNAMFYDCSKLSKLVLGPKTSLSKVGESEAVTDFKWIKGAVADQDVVDGTYLLTANEDIADGKTEIFQKAVFFSANDGTGKATAYSLYELDWTYNAEKVADAAREGYVFNGWYTDVDGGTKLKDGDALSPTTYYAQWTQPHSLPATGSFGLAILCGLACVAGLAGLYRRHRMAG